MHEGPVATNLPEATHPNSLPLRSVLIELCGSVIKRNLVSVVGITPCPPYGAFSRKFMLLFGVSAQREERLSELCCKAERHKSATGKLGNPPPPLAEESPWSFATARPQMAVGQLGTLYPPASKASSLRIAPLRALRGGGVGLSNLRN